MKVIFVEDIPLCYSIKRQQPNKTVAGFRQHNNILFYLYLDDFTS